MSERHPDQPVMALILKALESATGVYAEMAAEYDSLKFSAIVDDAEMFAKTQAVLNFKSTICQLHLSVASAHAAMLTAQHSASIDLYLQQITQQLEDIKRNQVRVGGHPYPPFRGFT